MLEVNNITVKYGAVTALKDINVTINDGEFVSLIGANGAGKTTFLKSISGLLKTSEGTIEFNGKKINGMAAHKITAEGIAMCPEGRIVFPNLTVSENLDMGGFLFRKNQQVFKETKEMVYELFPKLAERKNQRAGTFSGGEQQMLAIGRAMMSRPKLLMLDEPSLGLSPKFVNEVFQFVYDLHRNANLTVLLVEQLAVLALQMSDRAYVIDEGHIVMSGTGSDLREDPKVQEVYMGKN